ncbi:PSD1 and planctomycete cytochrome C domain-containing protein [Roseiconus lacunae]|uniref:PSD1 and planctomycete cytochrome C domain-containing protein n=1 Tax=Roseiconus lacunae TaxID=2605694 RepID=UPI001E48BAC6|nr:PSD1 and planctomycete cytochrome C domain-containing protein [Roseiconus lacunae]MCD0458019.1 PSD1 and planctomycete cytochrome C domain-containing protein [Roseiconus lacunae]
MSTITSPSTAGWATRRMPVITPIMVLFTVIASSSDTALKADDISFSRDVLPVLSDRCFHCHGPDATHREADLRLDVEENAKEDLGGYAAVTPGNLEESEIWRRITSNDEGEVMPPSDSHRKPLTDPEREAIRRWIVSGAKWGKHWSFEKITRPTPPSTDVHPVDAFVQAKLASEDLELNRLAPPHTQLRRLSFDLTGLAPTPEQVDAFDGSKEALGKTLDAIFQSPSYAERMAMWWLDASRYSDSDGYQQDATRQNWPWRDWVIRQFQENRSFREFTIEQFAGDLLPDATEEQQLATCFHRNHMTNGEGGRDPEESRVDYVIDRVNTTGTVWLGLTLGCVQCHSHKFDPISHQDYYSFSAFFNSIDENGKAGMNATPYLSYTSPNVDARVEELSHFVDQCRKQKSAELKRAEKRFERWLAQAREQAASDYRVWWPIFPQVTSSEGTLFQIEDDGTIQTHGPKPSQDDYRVEVRIPAGVKQISGIRLEVLPHESHVEQRFTRSGNGEFTLTNVLAMVREAGSPSEQQLEFAGAVADYQADKKRKTEWDTRYANIRETLNDDARDGWTTEGAESIEPHTGVYELRKPWQVSQGDRFIIKLRHRSTHGDANIGRFRISLTEERGETVRRTDGDSPIAALLRNNQTDLDDKLRKRLLDQYLLSDPEYQADATRLSAAERQLSQLKKETDPRKVMVLKERDKPRETHILLRGVWDAKGDVVERAVLPSVLEWPADKTQTRLDLAQWIVDRDNPLTARVIVNQVWQLLFGQGLVRTPEDFGLQGELPTHPKLLDWLAIEFIENDWDIQHIIRVIVTSKTYRQSSVTTEKLLSLDPENRLLARSPRFRLPAWMIRDNALQVSGLINSAVGGPPVKPYQPEGVWAEITMGRFDYQPSLGPAQYRRTIYAFWRRSSAPTFLFDSAQRRVCEVGVRRTNTPLHALTLMNDQTMLEASRALADLAMNIGTEPNEWSDMQLQMISHRVLSRELTSDELNELKRVWSSVMEVYQNETASALEFCCVGQQEIPPASLAAPTAAWMTIANLILNLDEAITRE